MGCLSWLRDLFGLGNKPVGPAGSKCIDFDGIDPNDVETKNLARLISMTHPRGTEDRWKEVERQLRKDLCEKDEHWEDKKSLSAKGLLTRTKKVYELRKSHVDIPPPELAKLMKSFELLIRGKDAVNEDSGKEEFAGQAAKAAEGQAAVNGDAATPEGANEAGVAILDGDADPKKNKKKKKARDYSADAMKLLSQEERASLDMREDGFEYGEVVPESFFALLYKLKYIHGHMWPPSHKKGGASVADSSSADDLENVQKKKKKSKKGRNADDGKVVADSFMDLGSGAGKAVFCAALFFEFAACGGVEMIAALSDAAKELGTRWADEIGPTLKGKKADTRIEFEGSDVRHSPKWAKGSFLFLNAPTLSEDTLEQLAIKANGKAVRPESVAIVVSRPWKALNKDKWILIAEDSLECSWGVTKVFVYEKLAEGGSKPFPQTTSGSGGGQNAPTKKY
eukprot:CAMPEP_0171929004 /NCGR_PEP_ID=MMETSP0993-20121228/27235_1 /TAXON_ID=483369 /ORGANISM="non described non described, Strain CCMP2098" /LENGTH=451 /DNA_ID=CAMNT_0012568425 /DNA_START=86 /DNA_END=1444 /DNA_ORIENTATION=-